MAGESKPGQRGQRDADISQSHSMKDWRLLESETWICANLHSV